MKILVSLTFDDGNKVQYTKFHPILNKYEIKATFYLVTSRINRPGYMRWDEIKDLYEQGNEIGSHTHTHPHLTRLSDIELDFELRKSRDLLSRFMCKSLAYPYGEYDRKVIDYAKKYYITARGYTIVNSGDYGYNFGLNHERYKLKVFPAEGSELLELSFSRFKENVKKIVENSTNERAWMIFVFHGEYLRNALWALYKRKYKVAIDSIGNLVIDRHKMLKVEWMCNYLASNDLIDILTISEGVSEFFNTDRNMSSERE